MDYEEGDGDHPEMSRLCFGTLMQVLLSCKQKAVQHFAPSKSVVSVVGYRS